MTYAVGIHDMAFRLDGINDFVAVGQLALGSVFSIEGWINPTALTNDMMILCRDDLDAVRSYFFQLDASGALVGSVVNSNGGLTRYRSSAGVISAGQWQHVAMVYDGQASVGQRMAFYVNGAVVAAAPVGGEDVGGVPAVVNSAARLGADLADGSLFNGLLDEVAVYSRTLNSGEIQALHAAGAMAKCKPSPYDLYYGTELWIRGSGANGHVNLQRPGFQSAGVVRMESTDAAYTSSMTITSGRLTNTALEVVNVNAGSGGARVLYGDFLNWGLVNVNWDFSFDRTDGQYENRGTINVAPSRTLSISGKNQVFHLNAGVLNVQGAMDLTSVTLNYMGGSLTGTPYLVNSRLFLGAGAVHAADFTLTGSGSTFVGDIKPQQLVRLQGSVRGNHTTVTVTNGFSNEGTLILQSIDGGYNTSLTVNNGTLTNQTGGVISINQGAGGPRVLSANLLNLGTVNINFNMTFSKNGGVYENAGFMNIDSGQTLSISGQNQVFRLSGGVITNNGGLDLTSANFIFEGGKIVGNTVYLDDCRLEIGPFAATPAGFTMTGSGSRYYGNLKAGQTLWFQGSSRGSHTIVIAPEGFRNEGTLRIESIDGGYETSFSVTNGVFTNAVGGVVNINGGAGGGRNRFASILNQGTINVIYNVNCNRSGGGFLNEGVINIASGQTLTIASPLTQVDGVLRLNGGTLDPNDSVALNGGVLTGNGTVAASVTNTVGRVSPGASAGTLNISGGYVQGSRGILEIELGGPVAGTDYDRLVVSGTARLEGRLAVSLINGFVPTNGQSFTILTAVSRIGTFTELQLPPLPDGQTWEVLHEPASGVAGLRGQVELSHERNGRTYKGGGTAFAGVTVGVSASVQGCTGTGIEVKVCAEPVVFKVSVEGSIEVDGLSYSTSTGYERELLPGGCYPPEDGVVKIYLADFGIAAKPSAGEMAQLLGFSNANEMVRDLTGRNTAMAPDAPVSHLSAALQSARSGGGTAALLTAPFRRSQITYGWTPPRPATLPVGSLARAALPPAPLQNGVCAQVRLQIDQEAVLTRKAIGATLDIFNESNVDPLENLNVTISILDPDGNLANDKFVILPPELVNIEPVTGATNSEEFQVTRDLWRMAPATTGRARWIILPRDEAAPETPLVYSVGGIMTYSSGGVPGTAMLLPSPVTVYPNPKLVLKYFHQRDVMSDDPFTPEIEPAEPFTLAVMVQNVGQGIAKKFTITSAQPKIIENEKGLQIDFSIIATEGAGQQLSPSLTAVFGDIGPNQITIGRWLMKASLLGFFVDYKATFEHESSLGGRETSLIDSVEIHEMIRQVQATGAFEDGKPDFLVNDVKDDLTLPDVLFLSDGSTSAVAAVAAGTVDDGPGPGHLVVSLTAPMPSGWAYLRVPDPGDGQYILSRVERQDGGIIPLNTNVWISRYTFTRPGVRPTRENVLHLLDYDSPGVYYLHYTQPPTPDLQPPTSSVAALPPASFPQIPVRWSGTDNGGEVNYYDIFVSINDGPFVPWLQRVRTSGAVYEGTAGNRYAFYSVATDAAGNVEPAPLTPQAVTTVSLINTAPQLSAIPNTTLNEGETLQISASALDTDQPAQQLTFSLGPGAPAGVNIHPQTGVLTWPTGESHGGTTNNITVVVTDNGTPPLSTNRVFTVVVNEVNSPPTVPALIDRRVNAGQIIGFYVGATDVDVPANALTYSLDAGAPAGASVHPTTGLFQWTPTLAQSPSTNLITVRVTDNGSPSKEATSTFTVIVNRPNQPPSLTVPVDQVVDEGALLLVSASANDDDLPAQQLTFSLENPPAGATIHPVSRIISWSPAEAQGPATNQIRVKVTDNGSPSQSTTRSFSVVVNEVNEPPAWPSNIVFTAAPRQPSTNVVNAADPDLPSNRITYSLAAGHPPTATLDAATGRLIFVPGTEHAGWTNWLTVVATDDGQPALSATTQVAIVVSDMVDLKVGRRIVSAGQSDHVPLTLVASAPLTNVQFTLRLPEGYLTNLVVASFNALVNPEPVEALASDLWRVRLGIGGTGLSGTQELAQINFTVLPQVVSTVVALQVESLAAKTATGEDVAHVWAYDGRVIVVGTQPLLDITVGGSQIKLLLYETPGTTLQLQTTPRLEPPPAWENWMRLTITNFETEVLDLMTNRALFYRAFRTNAP